MRIPKEISRLTIFTALVFLIAVGVNTMFEGSRLSLNPLREALMGSFVWLTPLLVVSYAVLFSSRKNMAFTAAFIAIFFGVYVEFIYSQAHDPTKALYLVINLLAYWVAGFIALLSVVPRKT